MVREPLDKKSVLERAGEPGVSETFVKLRRPTAQDYLGMGVQFKREEVPTYEEFIEDQRQIWQQQLREPEKYGVEGYKAPIDFKQYLRESKVALIYQIEEIIPQKFKEGLLSNEDAAAATELGTIVLSYVERYLNS